MKIIISLQRTIIILVTETAFFSNFQNKCLIIFLWANQKGFFAICICEGVSEPQKVAMQQTRREHCDTDLYGGSTMPSEFFLRILTPEFLKIIPNFTAVYKFQFNWS